MDKKQLIEVNWVKQAVAKETSRYAIAGVHFEPTRITATDGCILLISSTAPNVSPGIYKVGKKGELAPQEGRFPEIDAIINMAIADSQGAAFDGTLYQLWSLLIARGILINIEHLAAAWGVRLNHAGFLTTREARLYEPDRGPIIIDYDNRRAVIMPVAREVVA